MFRMSKKQKSTEYSLEDVAKQLFVKAFDGREPTVIARAPGRVNLIGEHTDYSQGYCFPMAISLGTVCCIGRASGNAKQSTLVSVQSNEKATFNIGENATEEWAKYVAGVAAQYKIDFAFEAAFASDVPLGGGLSSSAALDVSIGTALEQLIDNKREWDPAERALKCVEGDHTFVGVPCGIMDQFASSCSKLDHALLIDCQSNTGKLVSLTDPSISFVVTNTNIKHSHSGGEYGARVRECKEAAAALGVSVLREVTDVKRTDAIQNECLKKRARHVVSENIRTLEAAQAAEAKDWKRFGELMNSSHDSLKDDFEVSCRELDFLVSIARKHPGVFGSRMTGGGFGGCIVTLCTREVVSSLISELEKQYQAQLGLKCISYVFERPSNGAEILHLS